MKKRIYFLGLVFLTLILGGCNKKYEGYWCNYDETATIVVLLKRDNTDENRKQIESKIESFENVESSNYYSREDYAAELGEDIDNLDINDTFVILFNSIDSIGTYVEELEALEGVASAEQSNAKTNIALYNLMGWGKYTFTNSDEAEEADLETGKYKLKKGVITFTPDKEDAKTRLLYTKDGLLCGDADCTEIFARSNKTCSSQEEDEESN